MDGLHLYLEEYTRDIISTRYKEVAFSTPVGELQIPLEVVLKAPEDDTLTEDLIDEVNEELKSLSSFQRRLILEISAHGKTPDQLSEELGIDVGTIQDDYDDALAILQENLRGKSG